MAWQEACNKCPNLPEGEQYPDPSEVVVGDSFKVTTGGEFDIKEAAARVHEEKEAISYKLMLAGNDENDYKSYAEVFMWIPLENLGSEADTSSWFVRKTREDAGKAFKLATDMGIVSAEDVKGMDAAEAHAVLIDKFAELQGRVINTSMKWEAYAKKDTGEVKGPYFSVGQIRVAKSDTGKADLPY